MPLTQPNRAPIRNVPPSAPAIRHLWHILLDTLSSRASCRPHRHVPPNDPPTSLQYDAEDLAGVEQLLKLAC